MLNVRLAIVLVFLTCHAVVSQPPTKPAVDGKNDQNAADAATIRSARPDLFESGVAAVVNREIITIAEVRDAIRANTAGMGAAQKKEMYQRKLVRLIEERVMDQATARLHLILNPQHILSFIEREKERLGGEGAYREFLMEQNQTHEQHIDAVTQQSSRDLYLRAYSGQGRGVGDVLRAEHSVNPTAREIRKYYEEHLKDEFSAIPEADIWYMAITIGSTAVRTDQGIQRGTRAKALEKAKKIQEDLNTGADFATLAKLYSPITADTGGYAGWHNRSSSLLPAIIDHAFKCEIGKVSDPIEFRTGYLLVKVAARKEAAVVPFAKAQVSIRQKILGERTARARASVAARIIREAYIYPGIYKVELLRSLDKDRRGF